MARHTHCFGVENLYCRDLIKAPLVLCRSLSRDLIILEIFNQGLLNQAPTLAMNLVI